MKKLFSLLLVTVLLFSFSVSVFANEAVSEDLSQVNSGENFEYKMTPGNPAWADLSSKQEMLDATRIPNDVLKRMTTEEVVNAVLNYPLVINIYAYDSYEAGLRALAEDSDAFRELLTRPDAGDKLLNKLQVNKTFHGEQSLEELTLSVLLSDTSIWQSVSDKHLAEDLVLTATNSTVKTPKGSSVPVIIRGEELTSTQRTQLNNQYTNAYPNATFVSTSTSNYNCHSYAWYSDSTSNTYWMNDPSRYMTDGSYSSFTNLINAVIGTRVYYDNGEHSGIVYQAGGPLASSKYLKVISKWGMAPLMKHQADYSPYASNNLTLWKKN
ncbi:hypothetical protein G8C92_27710 [Paenibacillus donghaensis]|uniref:hypothetical protein n=1 Tax=Paenibacillus donghaensis TaxID=414771 RepID=UPI0018833AAB|nr:hypothetical protein [Paenibacillus donghaensis]MBE9917792.1 hypothetical protein [Paenibacillus donghaensis]